MQDLLRQIRAYTKLSQKEMAEELGVTFATINRWENGHVIPNGLAQNEIYNFCVKYNIPIADYVIQKIEKEASEIEIKENHLLLYHGSKSGIEGAIKPISRPKCDFGSGFYLGNEIIQPLTLICEFLEPKLYIVSIDK